jgi:hypothetical protein
MISRSRHCTLHSASSALCVNNAFGRSTSPTMEERSCGLPLTLCRLWTPDLVAIGAARQAKATATWTWTHTVPVRPELLAAPVSQAPWRVPRRPLRSRMWGARARGCSLSWGTCPASELLEPLELEGGARRGFLLCRRSVTGLHAVLEPSALRTEAGKQQRQHWELGTLVLLLSLVKCCVYIYSSSGCRQMECNYLLASTSAGSLHWQFGISTRW